MRRLEEGEKPDSVALDIAPRTGLTPGQAVVYMDWLFTSGRFDVVRYAKHAEKQEPGQQAWW
ncbi:hypothetical protein [Zavarzinella formosa]|uniref:hypothetical protein n=1 Tax=Zavarzinella formosa TaxID=360055 RepID=UPI0002E65642|nr:hypothetical protein [Zavarzinella formosa]